MSMRAAFADGEPIASATSFMGVSQLYAEHDCLLLIWGQTGESSLVSAHEFFLHGRIERRCIPQRVFIRQPILRRTPSGIADLIPDLVDKNPLEVGREGALVSRLEGS